MTQDKELLLKDLCARLPYNVKVSIGKNKRDDILCEINTFLNSINNTYADVKPYLFPLSSMTKEQKKELDDTLVNLNLKALSDEISSEVIATYEVDFYNKYHFDYRGLIEKGLAIDATGLNIY